jgi:two-component system, response regulator
MTQDFIMLVDDDPDAVDLMLRALRKNQIHDKVLVFKNGREALVRLTDATSQIPKMIILDLNLPGVDGHEVLRNIRSHVHTELVPVIILTGSDQEKDLEQSYREGANSVVLKPLDIGMFEAAVGRISQYWLGVNEPPPTL